jgi:bisphosphoglycerate-independent phosphoglycerate mutase (AlkP superfamily)
MGIYSFGVTRGSVLIAADYSNFEKLVAEDCAPHTAHAMNTAPRILVMGMVVGVQGGVRLPPLLMTRFE